MIFDKLKNKEATLAVIGLGYVGLPIAIEFSKNLKVIGYDIDKKKIQLMQNQIDPNKELESSEFENCDILFTSEESDLEKASFYIVAVPTPIDESNLPDLSPLIHASKIIGKVLKKGDYVVYESTVYPGCTEDDCIPVIEKSAGKIYKKDFKVGYSPERINPGDKVNTLKTVVKVVSGCDEESTKEIAKIYELIVKAGVHKAPSIKVAEASKIIENTQRDVNIALVNELSIIFNRVGLNTYDVLEAARTKWNFLDFSPGLVGGHCIGVDPYYLTHKAKKTGYHAKVINSGRYVNDSMGFYIGKQTVKKILAQGTSIIGARVLIMGATFKENVSDIRNSKVMDVAREIESFSCNVEIVDTYADSKDLEKEYGIGLVEEPKGIYDAIILAVSHREYLELSESYFKQFLPKNKGIFVDVKGKMKDKIKEIEYWSL